MNMEFKTFMGILYLVYGVSKLIIGTVMMALPADQIARIPILKKLVEDGKDDTISGHMYEYMLMLFGVYTILYGSALLGFLPYSVLLQLERKQVEYSVFIVIGLILVIFYSLVLYTKLPIPKEEKHRSHYLWFGLGGGISFLIMPVIWELLAWAVPALHELPYATRSLVILGGSIFAVVIIGIIWTLIRDNGKKPKFKVGQGVELVDDDATHKPSQDPN